MSDIYDQNIDLFQLFILQKIIDGLESPTPSVLKRTRDQRSEIRDGYSNRRSRKRVRYVFRGCASPCNDIGEVASSFQ